jgi:hypothetical protein
MKRIPSHGPVFLAHGASKVILESAILNLYGELLTCHMDQPHIKANYAKILHNWRDPCLALR